MPETETKIISNLEKAGVEFTNGDEPGGDGWEIGAGFAGPLNIPG
jgi:hypothetical protein